MSCGNRNLIAQLVAHTAKAAIFVGLATSGLGWFSSPAIAETVLERVARTGELVAGTRTDAIPFAYQTQTEWSGFSIDLLERIRAQLAQQLNRPVQLKLVAVDSVARLPMLNQGGVDIICGTTSLSNSRALDVDFSIGYFLTGTQLLIDPSSSLGSEFSIGVVAGTTNQRLIQQQFPIAQIVEFRDRATALAALESNRIDALASDGVLLEGMRRSNDRTKTFEIVPNQPYDRQEYACAVPQNQPQLRQMVDTALLQFMQGVLNQNPADLKLLDTWFGETGVVLIDRQALLNYFKYQVQKASASTTEPVK
jgi:polar amino acid transport system substrate-binding protein